MSISNVYQRDLESKLKKNKIKRRHGGTDSQGVYADFWSSSPLPYSSLGLERAVGVSTDVDKVLSNFRVPGKC